MKKRFERSRVRTVVTFAAMAVAIACIVIAAAGDAFVLIPALLVCSAGALLWKYIPLAAPAPALVAAIASVPDGSPEMYLAPAVLLGIFGAIRHFKLLPGGWSEP